MANDDRPSASRRDFLTGKAVRKELAATGEALADELVDAVALPEAGSTIRLATTAMACEFSVIMNPGPSRQVMIASDALDRIHELEAQLTVYRDDSEISQLNRQAASKSAVVEPNLFSLLRECNRLATETDGAFDATSGLLITLWRACREANRIPSDEELRESLDRIGMAHVVFDEDAVTIRFDRDGVELNLGGIGKGYALDVVGEMMIGEGLDNFLLHGGRSSILARGDHDGQGGWPVGIRNPAFANRRLATILLRDVAMSTSGSSVQFFRHEGTRYGHILDPRTGCPTEKLLSATVIAPTAAEADALSTAFFVMGVENAHVYCDNHPGVGAILIPPPRSGRRLEPVICGIPDDILFFTDDHTPGPKETT
jgi:thiamine biosynthesis lipoprotein